MIRVDGVRQHAGVHVEGGSGAVIEEKGMEHCVVDAGGGGAVDAGEDGPHLVDRAAVDGAVQGQEAAEGEGAAGDAGGDEQGVGQLQLLEGPAGLQELEAPPSPFATQARHENSLQMGASCSTTG